MKAQVITNFGDANSFKTIEIAKPSIKPGFVLIKVLATSVNPIDYKIRSGLAHMIAPEFPAILQGDVAGIIEEVGAGVDGFKLGDEVYGCAGGVKGEGGALAEYMLADARLIAKKPKILSMEEAAALPLVSITAWEALFQKIKIAPGQKILVHAGAGGVGHIAVQLAKWAGADVYATVSSSEKAELVKKLGAIEVINYKEESVQDYVNRITKGHGFEVVFDTVGGKNIDASIEAIALYGHVVTIQSKSTHDLSLLQNKSASLHVVFMLLPLLYKLQRDRHGAILSQIAKIVDEGHLKPLIYPQKFSFKDVGPAHALLESGKTFGKVVLSRD